MRSSLTRTQSSDWRGEFDRTTPIFGWEYVTVTFPSTPGTDITVPHGLQPTDPEAVDYEVVKADRAARVYNDQSGTRHTWGVGDILLRCDTANAVIDLRLTKRRV